MKRLVFIFGILTDLVFAQEPIQKFADQFSVHLQCNKYEKRLFGFGGEKFISSSVALGLIANINEEYKNDVLQEYGIAVLNDVENPGGIKKELYLTIDSIESYQVDINRKTLSGTFAGRNLKCKKVSKKQYLTVLNSILEQHEAKFKDNKI